MDMEWFKAQFTLIGLLFVVFTALAFIARGKDAFNWTKAKRESGIVNIGFIIFNTAAGIFLYFWIQGVTAAYSALSLPAIPLEFWANWPTLITALVFLLVYDFNIYWIHRFLHKSFFWHAHAVHHSDTEMHFLSWSRGHILEHAVLATGLIFMGTWLGLTAEDIYLVVLIKALHQYYVHSNLDWNHGPLRNIIVSPRFHRWHHANVESAYDKNYASIFVFYDHMFGSYYCPGPAKDIPTGFDTNPGDKFIPLLMYPIVQWGKMLRNLGTKPNKDPIEAAE